MMREERKKSSTIARSEKMAMSFLLSWRKLREKVKNHGHSPRYGSGIARNRSIATGVVLEPGSFLFYLI